jgi:cell division protein FtsB
MSFIEVFMTFQFQAFMAIVGLALSIGSFASSVVKSRSPVARRRTKLYVAVASFLFLLSAEILFELITQYHRMENLERMLLRQVDTTPRTIEELTQRVPVDQAPLVSEALNRLVNRDAIHAVISEVFVVNVPDYAHQVTLYYAK